MDSRQRLVLSAVASLIAGILGFAGMIVGAVLIVGVPLAFIWGIAYLAWGADAELGTLTTVGAVVLWIVWAFIANEFLNREPTAFETVVCALLGAACARGLLIHWGR